MNEILKAKQIKFNIKGTAATEIIGGIGVYLKRATSDVLMFVICGDSGGYIMDADDINVIKVYDDWVPISEDITDE